MAVKLGDAKISDSHRGFRFEIRAKDIENGQPNDPCACAAALALKRITGADEVRVYRDVTYVKKSDKFALRYHTSPALRLETIVFDRDGNFYPGEYDLNPMPLRSASNKSSRRSPSAPVRRSNAKREYRRIPNVRPTASQRLP